MFPVFVLTAGDPFLCMKIQFTAENYNHVNLCYYYNDVIKFEARRTSKESQRTDKIILASLDYFKVK